MEENNLYEAQRMSRASLASADPHLVQAMRESQALHDEQATTQRKREEAEQTATY